MTRFDAVDKAIEAEVNRRMALLIEEFKGVLKGNGRLKMRKANGNGGSPARRLQGKYMGLVRNLNREQKAKVKGVREAKGVRAAIAEAKRIRASA